MSPLRSLPIEASPEIRSACSACPWFCPCGLRCCLDTSRKQKTRRPAAGRRVRGSSELLLATLLTHTPRRIADSLDALSTNGLRRGARHRHSQSEYIEPFGERQRRSRKGGVQKRTLRQVAILASRETHGAGRRSRSEPHYRPDLPGSNHCSSRTWARTPRVGSGGSSIRTSVPVWRAPRGNTRIVLRQNESPLTPLLRGWRQRCPPRPPVCLRTRLCYPAVFLDFRTESSPLVPPFTVPASIPAPAAGGSARQFAARGVGHVTNIRSRPPDAGAGNLTTIGSNANTSVTRAE